MIPATGAWSTISSPTTASGGQTATLLPSGKILFLGVASAELYDPATATWSSTGSPIVARNRPACTLLANGMVLATGGYSPSGETASAESCPNPATGT